MTTTPRSAAESTLADPRLPAGADERVTGYAVMSLPFVSGHVLALHHFPASSVGPGYRDVWHRSPDGSWTFYSDVAPAVATARYVGAASTTPPVECPIEITWTGPASVHVAIDMILTWDLQLSMTSGTNWLNRLGSVLPGSAWESPNIMRGVGRLAGPLLHAGHIGLAGRFPSGQRFVAQPRRLWAVTASVARIQGRDIGPIGPLQEQARLGDFWLPQRGLFAVGTVRSEAFDPTRHAAPVEA